MALRTLLLFMLVDLSVDDVLYKTKCSLLQEIDPYKFVDFVIDVIDIMDVRKVNELVSPGFYNVDFND